jgi:hypothetical protein
LVRARYRGADPPHRQINLERSDARQQPCGARRPAIVPGPWRGEILAGVSANFGRLSNQDRLANRSLPRRAHAQRSFSVCWRRPSFCLTRALAAISAQYFRPLRT